MATTGKKINLTQLDKELGGLGLIGDFTDDKNKLILPAEGSSLTEAELNAGIAAHNAEPEIDHRASALAKLAALGLSADEIAAL
jgi:hypothetical protein